MEYLRDDYLDCMTFKAAAPQPIFVELFGPLVGLDDEWRQQGAAETEIGLTAFGFDCVRRHRVSVNTSLLDPLPTVIVAETPEYVVSRDGLGRRTQLFKETRKTMQKTTRGKIAARRSRRLSVLFAGEQVSAIGHEIK